MMAIPRKWEVQSGRNPWFSLGFHIDHTDPSITFHFPNIIICVGNCKQPGFKRVDRNDCELDIKSETDWTEIIEISNKPWDKRGPARGHRHDKIGSHRTWGGHGKIAWLRRGKKVR